jgi:hypothetical protein
MHVNTHLIEYLIFVKLILQLRLFRLQLYARAYAHTHTHSLTFLLFIRTIEI